MTDALARTHPRGHPAVHGDRATATPPPRRAAVGPAPTPPPRWIDIDGGAYVLAQIPSRAWYEWHWYRGHDPDAPRWFSARLRQQIIDRDGYRCALCNLDVEPDDVHIDHIKPRSRGGSDHPDNLQVTHSACNLRKGATWPG
jgi:hypothetical protein